MHLPTQYCTPVIRDVPNMAQKELGTAPASSAATSPATTPQPSPAPSPPPSPLAVPGASSAAAENGAVTRTPGQGAGAAAGTGTGAGAPGWAASLRQMVWDKWRWGVILALAIVVSRLSTSN